MNWSTRHKLFYLFGTVAVLVTVFLLTFRNVLFPEPTCFDKKQNGFESGIDCGGTCSLRCSDEVMPIAVVWTRVLKTGENTYDFAAMVSNKNINNTSRALGYSFVAYDEEGNEMIVINGTTTVPVDSDFPILKQNILLQKEPKELLIKLQDTPHFLVSENPASPTVRVVNTKYETGDVTRVYSTIVNTKRVTVSDLPIVVVLYDLNGNAMAAGETIIKFLDKEASSDIVFTWKNPLPKISPKIRVYPIFDSFLSN